MLTTKRKPASVGEILTGEFMAPMGLTQGALAEAMGVQRKHVNELCNDRRKAAAPTALILARVFGNSADFRLNVQRRSDLWEPRRTRLSQGSSQSRSEVFADLSTSLRAQRPRPPKLEERRRKQSGSHGERAGLLRRKSSSQ